ncbi:unnamed protein product [Didymodactylos carnosus]|nr:unnamed protein product [Didymodactylos carnosus]CAF3683842.1 unnamed protein product [Didymodactylos carnosus]
MNPLMRVIPVPLPFRYQFTDVNNPYKVLWVTDKGYLTLGTPFYAIEPVERVEGIPAYIAPFWTHFVNVNETYISATVYNGLVNAPDAVRNVTKRTVERQYKENVNDSTLAFYRVIKLEWKNLITYVDNISNQSDILNLEFSAYLINGLSYNHSYWDSFLRFEYQLSDLQNQSKSPDYQQVLFGYRDGSPNGSYLQTSVSFSQNITEFLSEANGLLV